MFTRWGDLVYRFRFAVIAVVGAALLALGAYGTGLGDRLTQSGWFDPNSESVQGAQIADGAFGRDHMADVIVMYNAPEGKTIDDPEFQRKVVDSLTAVTAKYPDQISKINGTYWPVGNAPAVPSTFGSKDKKHAFASIAIVGDDDSTSMANYRVVADAFYIPGVDVEVSGLQPLGVTLNDTIAHDTKRMEVLALPAVAILLFFIFGGIVAAGLPLIIGGLTIVGATGLVMVLTNFTEVNSFVTGVVSMIGLGLAIDYGLFIVSRFREELAEGYDTRAAVRRSVVTSGRTVVFSATMIIASLGGVLLFPQGFLRSVAYGTIATVSLAALTAVTILPAMLAVLGPRVDMLGLKWFRKNKTAEQIENGFWGNLTRWVMKHPLKIAIPVTVGLLLLIIPVKNLAFGGINEKYLPPDNETRVALEHFYEVFPQKKTDPIQLVFVVESGDKADTDAIGQVWRQANQAPGLVEPFGVPSNPPNDRTVYRTSATLIDPTGNAEPTIDYLRAIEVPDNVTMYVTGQPTLMADSIDTLLSLMPWMILIVLFSTFVLMFLTFGSLVLPIKAALMSALGLGSTLGILTWIFIDGNGAGLLNFTPQPISAPVLMLIIAIIYGLSTDYEVFLLSRMVEARAQGASTTEAVRIGTAQTGRIITAAALILLVVTGAFAFSDMVMMQYIAYGMIAALFIDATVLRMLLVPAIMKLLGDDCWWAPKWMKRIQEKIGLGEPILDDERPQNGPVVDLVKTTPITDPPTMQMTVVPDSKLAKTPRRPRTVAEIEAEAPTAHLDKITEHTDPAEPARPRPPMSPDPTRPRAPMLSGEPRVQPTPKPAPEQPKPDQGTSDTPPTPGPSMFTTGEPTQILPVVKPGAEPPKPAQGGGDSAGPDVGSAGSRGTSGPDQRGASGSDTRPADPRGTSGSQAGPGAARNGRGSAPTDALGAGPASHNPNASGPQGFSPLSGAQDTPGTGADFRTPGAPGSGFLGHSTDSGVIGGAAPDANGVIGGPAPSILGGPAAGSAPRGSARVQPPAGYTPVSDPQHDDGPSASRRQRGDSSSPRAQSDNETGPRGFGATPPTPRTQPADDLSAGRPTLGGVTEPRVQPPIPGNPLPTRGTVSPGENPATSRIPGDTASTRRGESPAPDDGPDARVLPFSPSTPLPTRRSESSTTGDHSDASRTAGDSQPTPRVHPPAWADNLSEPRTPGSGPSAGGSPSTPPTLGDSRPTPRVQPPASGEGTGRTQPPTGEPSADQSGFGAPVDDSAQRPSIVTPLRPLGTPPAGFVPPPPPSIVNTPPPGAVPPAGTVSPQPPSIVTPSPRPVDPPAGGTFSGFTPLNYEPAHTDVAETETPEPESNAGASTDFSATPGAHRAETTTPADEQSPRDVFGTPVPVEPQHPTSSYVGTPTAPSGFRMPDVNDGPRFAQVTPEQDSPRSDTVRPQVAPPGFTAVPTGDTSPAPNTEGPQANPADRWQAPAAEDPQATLTNPWQAPAAEDPQGTLTNRWHAPAGEESQTSPADRSHTPATEEPQATSASRWQAPATDEPPADSSNSRQTTDTEAPQANPADRWATPTAEAPRPTSASHWQTPATDESSAGSASRWQAADSADPQATSTDRGRTPSTEQPQAHPANGWQAPDGFTAVPAPAPAPDDSASTAPESDDAQAESRNEIENWMAQLRSSRRGTTAPADDEGRHHGNEGRTVSVNELLRRREDDTD
ncbi:MMPL family transporter [Nocardia asteroides]